MPPKTIRGAIKDALENLGGANLEKFRSALLDRREEPRVAVSRVEGKSFLVITDVLVSTFCEEGAARVTLELLKEIKCFNDAKTLGELCNMKHFRKMHSNTSLVLLSLLWLLPPWVKAHKSK